MKNYTITVNGNVYDVVVEEGTQTSAPVAAPVVPPVAVPKVAAPKVAAPAPKAAPVQASAPATNEAAGSIKIEAGAAGKVFKIDAAVGSTVKRGEAVVTIEAMKMEIPVVAPEDGTVVSIDVAVGDAVEAGKVLATLN